MRSLWNALVADPEQRGPPTRWSPSCSRSRWSRRRRWSPRSSRSPRRRSPCCAARLGRARARRSPSRRPRAAGAGAHDVGWLGPLGAPGCGPCSRVLVAFGTAVGIIQVAVPAFADARGSAAPGGVLLAALSAGSLVGGVVYGARTWPATPAAASRPAPRPRRGFALLAVAETEVDARGPAGPRRAAPRPDDRRRLDPARHRRPIGDGHRGFAVMVMGIVVGTAAGNALGGALVESVLRDRGAVAPARPPSPARR